MRLSAEERGRLLADLDFTALERLLDTIPPSAWPEVLRFFRSWDEASAQDILKAFPELDPEAAERGVLLVPQPEDLAIEDPVQQDLLEQVLANRRRSGK